MGASPSGAHRMGLPGPAFLKLGGGRGFGEAEAAMLQI